MPKKSITKKNRKGLKIKNKSKSRSRKVQKRVKRKSKRRSRKKQRGVWKDLEQNDTITFLEGKKYELGKIKTTLEREIGIKKNQIQTIINKPEIKRKKMGIQNNLQFIVYNLKLLIFHLILPIHKD